MQPENYRSLDGINYSSLKYGFYSPKAMHWAMNKTDSDDPPTETMKFGTLGHLAMLEPDVLADRLVVFGAKKQGEKWETFKNENGDKTIVTTAQNKALMGMAKAIHSNPHAHRLIESTQHEQVLRWMDTGYGEAKAKVDGINNKVLVEFKTTKVETKGAFLNHCYKMKYFGQCAWYEHGATENGYKDLSVWIIGVMQHKWHDVWLYEVPQDILKQCYKDCRKVAVLYRCCEASGWFSGEQEQPEVATLPAWAWNDEEKDISTGTMEANQL